MKIYSKINWIVVIFFILHNLTFSHIEKNINASSIDGLDLTGWDFQKKRVLGKFYDSSFYQGTITITNYCYLSHKIDSLFIQDTIDNPFIIGYLKFPITINPQEAINIDVFFKPLYEGEFHKAITLSYDNSSRWSSQYLSGIGCQPHIKIDSIKYPNSIVVGKSKTAFTYVSNIVNNIKTSIALTIFNINIVGIDASSYKIDSSFFVNNPFPIRIQPEEYLKIPVEFSPTHAGLNEAQLIVETDAPEAANTSLTGIGITPDDVSDIQSESLEILNFNPMPFNSNLTINWFNPYNQLIIIKICDIMGNVILEQSDYLTSGNQNFTWQPEPRIQSGLYYFIISNTRETVRGKVIHIK